jgi:hypothetical protein
VRLTSVVTFDTTGGSDPCVVLRSGTRVRVARERVALVRAALG